jgi:RNA polymerase sigma-70 factor (ECF subfamily)
MAQWQTVLVEQIDRHGRWFYGLAFRILHDAGAAEDVCQSAFMAAWERRDEIRDPQALRSWLVSVIVNQSLQICRRRKREQQWVRDRQREGAVQSVGYESVEFSECFANALMELPEMTQTVVVLRLVEQMSGNEVKEVLGCSGSEVSRRLHAGMDHLRVRLADVYIVGR